jgi:signal transduction histidine kinase
VDLTELVASVADDAEIDAPEPATVWGVEDRLEELARNLVDNARVFARSRIRVSVRAGERVVLEVEDDGPGVSEGNRDKIFQRFFTLRPEGAERGSGLGLAIVRTIAAAHGGEVELADPGELGGARFRVTLPAAT